MYEMVVDELDDDYMLYNTMICLLHYSMLCSACYQGRIGKQHHYGRDLPSLWIGAGPGLSGIVILIFPSIMLVRVFVVVVCWLVCLFACMFVCMYVCLHVCLFCLFICFVCMFVCLMVGWLVWNHG